MPTFSRWKDPLRLWRESSASEGSSVLHRLGEAAADSHVAEEKAGPRGCVAPSTLHARGSETGIQAVVWPRTTLCF